MAMMCSCCGFEGEAQHHFDPRKAAQELSTYRKRGPGITTRLLRDGVTETQTPRVDVLDVGAGIGALAVELLQSGTSQVVAVDASSAFLAAARDETARRGLQSRVTFVEGDFLRIGDDLAPADVVTLDRVVCCYPLYEPLLAEALRHANHCIALSYPRDKFYVRAGMALENLQRRLSSNPFRTYLHSPVAMDRIIRDAGFTLARRRETWLWAADVYLRQSSN
jgi:magnesium-protoporphyrin O-methyltransferase